MRTHVIAAPGRIPFSLQISVSALRSPSCEAYFHRSPLYCAISYRTHPTKADTTLDPISIHLNDLVYNLYRVAALPLGLSNLLSIATLVVDKVKDIQSHRAGISSEFYLLESIDCLM